MRFIYKILLINIISFIDLSIDIIYEFIYCKMHFDAVVCFF